MAAAAAAAAVWAAASRRAAGTCATVDGTEQKQPHYRDEADAHDVGECCTMCGAEPWCVFWSFKASDVPNGIACRRFDAVSTSNKTGDASWVSGTPPPASPTPPPPPATPAPPRPPAPTGLNGVCYAAWIPEGSQSYDSPESDLSIAHAAGSGVNIIAIVYTYYQDTQNSTEIKYSDTKSNTDAGVKRVAAAARAQGLQVALKPHVDFLSDPTHWRGLIGPGFSAADWAKWFASYKSFATHAAQLAKDINADLFVVGTELASSQGNAAAWRDIVAACRAITGQGMPFTYAANWGCDGPMCETAGPETVTWWDAVDYIGVDAYYPLTTSPSQPVSAIQAAWGNAPCCGDIVGGLRGLHEKFGKPVLFTEIGYTTTDKCAMGNHAGGDLSMQAQADAYTAFFEAVYSQPWFAGVFFWDWETDPHGGGRCDGGEFSFTPAGKTAETVMQHYFGAPERAAPGAKGAGGVRRAAPGRAGARAGGSLSVYDNGNAYWGDYTYNCATRDLKATGEVYPGQQYSAHAVCQNWGALSFHDNRGVQSGDYTEVSFVIHSSLASGDQVQVALYGSQDTKYPFPAQFASHYVQSCHLQTGGWIEVSVPIADLLGAASSAQIQRIEFKTNYATGSGEIWVDKVAFGTSAPPAPPPTPAPPATPRPPAPPVCDDTPPDNQYTCAQQKGWGKCDTAANPWMIGYCCMTCFDCAPGCGA